MSNVELNKIKTPESSTRSGSSSSNSALALANEYFSSDMDLASFLIRAACENSVIANFFYWYFFFYMTIFKGI